MAKYKRHNPLNKKEGRHKKQAQGINTLKPKKQKQ